MSDNWDNFTLEEKLAYNSDYIDYINKYVKKDLAKFDRDIGDLQRRLKMLEQVILSSKREN